MQREINPKGIIMKLESKIKNDLKKLEDRKKQFLECRQKHDADDHDSNINEYNYAELEIEKKDTISEKKLDELNKEVNLLQKLEIKHKCNIYKLKDSISQRTSQKK